MAAKSAATMNKMWANSTCQSGKRIYPSRAIAKVAAKEQQKRGYGNMRPYTCPTCDRIHIGHPRVIW